MDRFLETEYRRARWMKIRGAIRCTEKGCHRLSKGCLCSPKPFLRELSSVGSERLPYKQRVGGSTPSAPTSIPATYSDASGFFCDDREHSSGVQSACLTSRRSAVQICMLPQAAGGLHVLPTVFLCPSPRRPSEIRRRTFGGIPPGKKKICGKWNGNLQV